MPNLDGRLRTGLESLAGEASGNVLDRVSSRKRRYRVVRRAQAGILSVAVLAATAGGIFGLAKAFRTPPPADLGSPSVGEIAFAAPSGLFLVRSDGTGLSRLTDTPGDTSPSWSPDGTRIAFVRYENGASNIYVMNAEGTGLTKLTTDGADSSPAWSPNGKEIAFAREANGNADIYEMQADGSNVQQLTFDPLMEYDPAWSPDGSRIAFAAYQDYPFGPPAAMFLYMMDLSTHERTKLATEGSQPVWSPNGTEIAFQGHQPTPDEQTISVIGADGSALHQLTAQALTFSPTWAPDGTRIAFAQGVDASSTRIYVMNSDGSGVHALADGPLPQSSPAWSPAQSGSKSIAPAPPSSPEPSVPSDAVIAKEIGPVCDMSKVTGDFDGDGAPDAAVIFFQQQSGSCDVPADQRAYLLRVWESSGVEETWPLPECGIVGYNGTVTPTGTCRAFAAPDLNGDGTDELAVETDTGTQTLAHLQFYVIRMVHAPSLITVAPGGPARVVGPALPLTLSWGDSIVDHARIECSTASDGKRQVVGVAYGYSRNTNKWTVERTPFEFGAGPASVTLYPSVTLRYPENSPLVQSLQSTQDICGAAVANPPPQAG